MSEKTFTYDMSMMYAVHDALRRDLARIARVTARPADEPAHILRTAIGWGLFKRYLVVHHTAEDETLWPVMRQSLAGRPGDLALLDAMESEHAAMDPMLAAVDAALADRNTGPARLGDLVDALSHVITAHLAHEEGEALTLIDATVTPEQWQHFGTVHRGKVGAQAPQYLPWLLDGASDRITGAVLVRLPEKLQAAYRDEWTGTYAALDLWGAP
jgi:hemerythrin-like domain-containing protein